MGPPNIIETWIPCEIREKVERKRDRLIELAINAEANLNWCDSYQFGLNTPSQTRLVKIITHQLRPALNLCEMRWTVVAH